MDVFRCALPILQTALQWFSECRSQRTAPCRQATRDNAEALKRSLLAAERVVYNRASSGVYIESMLKKLGVYDELGARLVRYDDGTAVMHHLMKGQGREFGFGGITDILLYRDKGLRLVGPLS